MKIEIKIICRTRSGPSHLNSTNLQKPVKVCLSNFCTGLNTSTNLFWYRIILLASTLILCVNWLNHIMWNTCMYSQFCLNICSKFHSFNIFLKEPKSFYYYQSIMYKCIYRRNERANAQLPHDKSHPGVSLVWRPEMISIRAPPCPILYAVACSV